MVETRNSAAQRGIGIGQLVSRPLRRFVRGERGVSAIEATACIPLLGILFLGGMDLWDQMKGHERVVSATDTVTDILAQGTELSEPDIGEMRSILANIVGVDRENVGIEVVSIRRDDRGANNDRRRQRAYITPDGAYLYCNWRSNVGDSAKGRGTEVPRPTQPDIQNVPTIGDRDSVIYVSTIVRKRAILRYRSATNSDTREFRSTAIVRPRFGPIHKTDTNGSAAEHKQNWMWHPCSNWIKTT